MMEIFWTMLASQDRKRIRGYIAEQNLMAAVAMDQWTNGLAIQPAAWLNNRIKDVTAGLKVPGSWSSTHILFSFMKWINREEKFISCVYYILRRSGHDC